MCDPVSIMMATGAAVSAAGTMYGAAAQSAGLKSQAQWAQREGAISQIQTAYEISQKKREQERLLGAQTAEFAGAGVDVRGGTPVDVALATGQEIGMDIQGIRFAGQEAVNRANYSASMAKTNAKAAMTAGVIGAGSTLLSGAAGIYNNMPQTGTMQANTVPAAPVGVTVNGDMPVGTSLVNNAFAVNTNPYRYGGPR
jgi:hypothetical protein